MPSEEREALRRKYAGLYEEVESILFRHDPAGINFEDNTDEYDPEVSTILPKVVHATSGDEVLEVVRDEFAHWFEGVSLREETFEPIAADVLEAVLRTGPPSTLASSCGRQGFSPRLRSSGNT